MAFNSLIAQLNVCVGVGVCAWVGAWLFVCTTVYPCVFKWGSVFLLKLWSRCLSSWKTQHSSILSPPGTPCGIWVNQTSYWGWAGRKPIAGRLRIYLVTTWCLPDVEPTYVTCLPGVGPTYSTSLPVSTWCRAYLLYKSTCIYLVWGLLTLPAYLV